MNVVDGALAVALAVFITLSTIATLPTTAGGLNTIRAVVAVSLVALVIAVPPTDPTLVIEVMAWLKVTSTVRWAPYG
jgi:hypothetical protein